MLLGYEGGGFYGAAYTFNGDSGEASTPAGEDTIEHFGASFGYLWTDGDTSLDVGVDYISSLADSDGLGDGLSAPEALQSFASATALHAIYTRNALGVIFEYISSDEFDAADLAFNGQGASVSAFNLEAGYDFGWGVAAIGYQGTDEAVGLGLPESRVLFAVSKEIFEATTLSFEHAMDEDYSSADGGTGNDASTTTIQLAVEF